MVFWKVLPVAILLMAATAVGSGPDKAIPARDGLDCPTLAELTDRERVLLIDCLPLRSSYATVEQLVPSLLPTRDSYQFRAKSSLFGHDVEFGCDFRGDCVAGYGFRVAYCQTNSVALRL